MNINEETQKYFHEYFIQMAEKNKDGKLSYDEFKKICWECLGDEENGEE